MMALAEDLLVNGTTWRLILLRGVLVLMVLLPPR